MCRLFGFRSSIQSSVHHSLIQAENALSRLSRKHTDGWGIAYYVDAYPHLIRNDRQALGDSLFRELSGVVSTKMFMAHIRLATAGRVRVLNCHPFQYGRWTFAHNGEIARFNDPPVREAISALVDPRYRDYLLGDTDSEVLFHLFLSQLSRRTSRVNGSGVSFECVLDALRETLQLVLRSVEGVGPATEGEGAGHKLTVLVSNGDMLLGYRLGKELHYSTYKSRCPERESCAVFEQDLCEASATDGGTVKHLMLASEPLGEGPNVWHALSNDEFVAVRYGMVLRQGQLGACLQ